ncbi:Adaptor complexes medium subunit family [Novymonas esmeraldas]|uniref:Adaptor complexes medium subunit family n=1 Tax=Novymonas esmeraldas TaxID=1808958 RepID=A0AAW0EVI1_9TRYP
MVHLSQLFVLAPRGDTLIFRSYRDDTPERTDEVFIRKFNFWDGQLSQAPRGDCPPFFTHAGVHYAFVKHRNLLIVCTTRANASPSALAEVLLRVVQLLKDHLGVVSEESVRKNLPLVYELLDEVVDVGVVQEAETDGLRPFIANSAVAVLPTETLLDRLRRADFGDNTKRSDEAAVSVLCVDTAEKNEIFVDLLERLTVVVNARGAVLRTAVDGALIVKSFLAGTPSITVGLSSEVMLRSELTAGQPAPPPGAIVLDGVSFHSSVDTSLFPRMRQVSLRPAIGELTVLRYRCVHPTGAAPPFRLAQSLELPSACRGVLLLRIHADYPADVTALAVRVCVPLPSTTVSAVADVRSEGTTHSYEWREVDRELCWHISKFSGRLEHTAYVRFTTTDAITPAVRREVGPVSVYFEIPQFTITGARVLSLHIDGRGTAPHPRKWIRCVTQAHAYTFRSH